MPCQWLVLGHPPHVAGSSKEEPWLPAASSCTVQQIFLPVVLTFGYTGKTEPPTVNTVRSLLLLFQTCLVCEGFFELPFELHSGIIRGLEISM